MKLAHFFHVYALSNYWQTAVDEHLAALNAAGYRGPVHLGIIGTREQEYEIFDRFADHDQTPASITTAETGWEQHTINLLHQHAKDNDGAVMYAHTKGAHDPSAINIAWRRSMTARLIRNCHEHANQLGEHIDAIGCHWLTQQAFPGTVADTPFPMFGGNFWIATCDYIRALPPCATNTRHDAEAWIGLNDPIVIDLLPGWPSHELFVQPIP